MLDLITRVLRIPSPELEEVDLLPDIHQALSQVKRPSVLQVVILRDGLLIGTEVFAAGEYLVGSGADCDLRLDDPQVAQQHALLRFRDGHVTVQAQGGALFVNGYPASTTQLRPVDDLCVGPFSLKIRVITQKPARRVPVPAPASAAKLRAVPIEVKTQPTRRAIAAATRTEEIPVIAVARNDRLFFELYWGEQRQHARAFGEIPINHPVVGALDDQAAMPLWGFELPSGPMVLADKRNGGYRVFVPRGAAVEQRDAGGSFQPLTAEQLATIGSRKFIALSSGDAVRFSSGESSLVASVQPAQVAPWINPLANLPRLATGLVVALLCVFGAFANLASSDEGADFTPREIPKLSVRLVKTERPKKVEPPRVTDKARPERTKTPKMDRPTSRPRPPKFKDVLSFGGETFARVLEGGIPMPPMVGGKRGSKPGTILGPAPIAANVGFGGLGNGSSFKGLGAMGSDGIGSMGARNTGKSKIVGRVERFSPRSVGLVGGIDRAAVAKVIESHLHEVSSCYERAMISEKDAGGGKLALEWSISTSGVVTNVKSRFSSMRSSAVESCIVSALKTWKFPAAKGAGVVISYPFLFNSVGY